MEVPSPRLVVPAFRIALRVAGAGLLIATGVIHLDLYLTGYRTIPTIGWLFLLQVIAAFGLAATVLVSGSGLPAAGGALFALSTLGGYLLSLRFGLFNFREVRTTAGVVAGIVEVLAFASLSAFAVDTLARPAPTRPRAGRSGAVAALESRSAVAHWTSAALAAVAAVLLGLSLAAGSSSPDGASANPVLRLSTVKGASIVTNEQGFTLYWFVPDTSSRSACYGTCAAYWPPVIGRPAAGAGVTGRISSIQRSNGVRQATYDGHPLYTYVGDTAPGQANGDDIDLNGGLWHAVRSSG